MILKFNINQQTIERQDTEKPVQHSKNYLKCQFTFSEEWERLTKKIYFSNGTETKINILDENDECSVPIKILNTSYLLVSAKGYDYDNNIIISTNQAVVNLKHSPKPHHNHHHYSCDIPHRFHPPHHHRHHHDCCCDDMEISHDVLDLIFKKINRKFDDVVAKDGKLYFYSDGKLIEEIDIARGSEIDPVFQNSPAHNISDDDLKNIKNITKSFDELNFIKDYLYEIYYSKLDYDNAKEYYLKNQETDSVNSACSSIRKGNFVGRNYDWIYNEDAEFIVKTYHKDGRFANISIGNMKGLTDEFVKSKEPSELYKILPFHVVDGINEYGLTVTVNVVPMDKTPTVETVPTVEKRDTLCTSMLPRYCLDYFKTASECVEYLEKYIALYVPKSLQEMHYESHFLIADSENTYLVELINNRLVVVDMNDDSGTSLSGKPYLTNFYLSDVFINADGSVYTPCTQDEIHNAKTINNITDNGCGLERYNIMASAYENIESKEDIRELLDNLKYTNAYTQTSDFWFTEFVGINNLNVASQPSEFSTVVSNIKTMFNNRSRDETNPNYGTWQTTHSSIYDIDEKSLDLIVQEDGEELSYNFDFYYTQKEIDELLNKYTIVDEITSESTNFEIPTAKAVWDLFYSLHYMNL